MSDNSSNRGNGVESFRPPEPDRFIGDSETHSGGLISDSNACQSVCQLIVMARWPEAGKAKTRLIPALGDVGAATLHSQLVRHTLATARQYQRTHPCQITVHFAGGSAAQMQELFGHDLVYRPQQGELLGDRMHFAIQCAFDSDCRRVVVIGTDCPALQVSHLAQAFASLEADDVSIGPALDGGYYLIGLRRSLPEIFHAVDWGTEKVLAQTLKNARRFRASVFQLSELSDVDFPEDLVGCRRVLNEAAGALPCAVEGLLSVIVPTFNEAANITRLVATLSQEPGVEIIVADGGSSDETCQLAENAGARVVRSGSGRGRQMNAGAALSRGETLLFLHADAQLPKGFKNAIEFCLSDSIAGAFRLRIDDNRWRFRMVEAGANLRSDWRQIPYGDQGLFLRSKTFFEMNGFANWPLMEDYEFVRRLRGLGRIAIADSAMTVSARRWHRVGVLRTTLQNQLTVAAYHLGVSPQTLARFYYRRRNARSQ